MTTTDKMIFFAFFLPASVLVTLFASLLYTIWLLRSRFLALKKQTAIYEAIAILRWSINVAKSGIPDVGFKGSNFDQYRDATRQFRREVTVLDELLDAMEKKWSPLWNISSAPFSWKNLSDEFLEMFFQINESFLHHRHHVDLLRLAFLECSENQLLTVDSTAAACLLTAKKMIANKLAQAVANDPSNYKRKCIPL